MVPAPGPVGQGYAVRFFLRRPVTTARAGNRSPREHDSGTAGAAFPRLRCAAAARATERRWPATSRNGIEPYFTACHPCRAADVMCHCNMNAASLNRRWLRIAIDWRCASRSRRSRRRGRQAPCRSGIRRAGACMIGDAGMVVIADPGTWHVRRIAAKVLSAGSAKAATPATAVSVVPAL